MINSILLFFLLFTSVAVGQNWEVFTPENSALETDVISEILVDDNNVVWLATGSGLAKYENRELTLLNSSNSILPTQNVTDLFIDKNNLLWVLYSDKIYRGINSGFELFRNDIGGSEIAVDNNGVIYIGNYKYLIQLSENNRLDTIYHSIDFDNRPIKSIIIEKKNTLWFTKANNYAEFWIYSDDTVIKSDSMDINVQISDFKEFKLDKLGNIWICGLLGTLVKYDIYNDMWHDMNEEYSLEFSNFIRVNALNFDINNNMHFVTTTNTKSPSKLYSYNGNEFEVATFDSIYPEELPFRGQSSMAIDNENNIYIAAVSVGLFKLNASTTSVATTTFDKIKIYPNPAKTHLNLDLGGEIVKSITITDLTGKEVITQNSELNNLNSIDISALITGQYFISFKLTDKSVIYNKFVKE